MKFMGFHDGKFSDSEKLKPVGGRPTPDDAFRVYVNAILTANIRTNGSAPY